MARNSSIGVASRVVRALPPLVCVSGSGLFDAGEATEVVRAGYTDQLVSILDIDHIEKPRAPIAGVLQDGLVCLSTIGTLRVRILN